MTKKYFNRDLSWLEFNRRVLEQAVNENYPLLERARFLSIFTSNLDEFCMKRIGYLKRLINKGTPFTGHDRTNPLQLLKEIRSVIIEQTERRAKYYNEHILPELMTEGIELIGWNDASKKEKEFLKEYFHSKVFPVLTPLAVDPAHPFPFLSNLSVSLGINLHQPKRQERLFARLKIPDVLPQWIHLSPGEGGKIRFIRLKDIIAQNLSQLFPEMVIENIAAFRVTRSADTKASDPDDIEDVMDMVEEELRMRRVAEIVRIEYEHGSDPWILNVVENELDLNADLDFYESRGELNFRVLDEICSLDIHKLKFKTWSPVTPPAFAEDQSSIFKTLRSQDVLVHFPYHSYTHSVARFIRRSAEDPQVLAIKITLYRTEERSELIPLLIEAAQKGKQVVVVVELKARFDEARNMYWSEMLEKAGVHVVYGVVGLKTHSKITLVVRKEGNDFRFYGHIGTGNYNATTSKIYSDLGLFTAVPEITNEMIEIFNYLTGLSLKTNYKKFLVSPINMNERFLDMIRHEVSLAKSGLPARIVAKMNSLEDSKICDELYLASQAGVKIELIVRGFCSLIPSKVGLSENIIVKSIVGRFLEHSRIYYFQNGSIDPEEGLFFIGSADWMHRNLNERVEAIVPVENKTLKLKLWEILDECLKDEEQSWILKPDGTYVEKRNKKKSKKGIQAKFMAKVKKELY